MHALRLLETAAGFVARLGSQTRGLPVKFLRIISRSLESYPSRELLDSSRENHRMKLDETISGFGLPAASRDVDLRSVCGVKLRRVG